MCGITREHTARDTTPMPLIIESSVDTTMDEDITDSESDDGGIFIQEPNANDVVAGRGNGVQALSGNQNYRRHIVNRKGNYLMAPNHQKTKIAESIIGGIKALDPPGRFLTSCENGWMEMSQKKALEKVMQALRDNKTNQQSECSSSPIGDFGGVPLFLGGSGQQADYPYSASKFEGQQFIGQEQHTGIVYRTEQPAAFHGAPLIPGSLPVRRDFNAGDLIMADAMGAAVAAAAATTVGGFLSPRATEFENRYADPTHQAGMMKLSPRASEFEHIYVDPQQGMKLLTNPATTQELGFRAVPYDTVLNAMDMGDVYDPAAPCDIFFDDQFSDSLDDDTDATIATLHLCRRAGLL